MYAPPSIPCAWLVCHPDPVNQTHLGHVPTYPLFLTRTRNWRKVLAFPSARPLSSPSQPPLPQTTALAQLLSVLTGVLPVSPPVAPGGPFRPLSYGHQSTGDHVAFQLKALPWVPIAFGEKLTPCLTGRALPDLTREANSSFTGFLG